MLLHLPFQDGGSLRRSIKKAAFSCEAGIPGTSAERAGPKGQPAPSLILALAHFTTQCFRVQASQVGRHRL